MENFPDKISPMTLAAAIALGSGGGGQPTGTVYYPAGSIPFLSLPALTLSRVGAVYDITDDFTSSSDFTDGGGKNYLAGTDVAIVNTGTVENPVLKYNCLTNAINEIVDQAKIGTSATGSDLTLSTSEGNINTLTVYGKSEVVNNEIVSAGEGYAVVRLADLTWIHASGHFVTNSLNNVLQMPASLDDIALVLCDKYEAKSYNASTPNDKYIIEPIGITNYYLWIKDDDYTTVSDFVASLGDTTIAYELADPSQGNAIAVKTDNGTGIDGTMATFSTGTPLRGIPDTSVRDVMQWNGSAGTVVKNCNKVRLADLTWAMNNTSQFYALLSPYGVSDGSGSNLICSKYIGGNAYSSSTADKVICVYGSSHYVWIKDTDYTTVSDFVASLGDTEVVYELATPTTQALTATENASIASLRTFTPQTHAQNNAGADMTVEAYAGTANGKAVNELKQDVQSEISELKITQSDTLTLTTAGWTNNAQTIAYAHDTAKRNVIDVDPASVEEWANCGILATTETASGITFTCKTVPTNALSFRVTSMGV